MPFRNRRVKAWHPDATHRRGAVLLEVVLALTLFVMSAAVIGGSVNMSLSALRSVRIQAQAADLAVTKLSEIQMGLRNVADDGPNQYTPDERLDDWTWQIVTTPVDSTGVLDSTPPKRVEIVIRNARNNYTYRLVQVMPSTDTDETDAGADASGGGG